MANNTMPVGWEDEPCFVVVVPKSLATYVGGLMRITEQRGFWATPEDYERGYKASIQFQECLMATCLNDLLEKQDAMYRLINTAIFGVTYATESTDPLVVTPAIAPHVTLDVHDQDSIMGRLDRVTQLVDNSINGTETPLYTYDPSVKGLLADIKAAIEAGDTNGEDLLAQLELIVGLLA